MKYILFCCCFLVLSGFIHSQEKTLTFPNNAIGIYKGNLQISSSKGMQTIPMEFHLKATNSPNTFQYILVYNNTPRNYHLIIKDKKKGLYEIDENNGIILPATYANNILFSLFEVQGNLLTTRLAFDKKQLDFEILFTRLKNKVKTGGTSKEIPEVFGYPISTIQRALLKKVD